MLQGLELKGPRVIKAQPQQQGLKVIKVIKAIRVTAARPDQQVQLDRVVLCQTASIIPVHLFLPGITPAVVLSEMVLHSIPVAGLCSLQILLATASVTVAVLVVALGEIWGEQLNSISIILQFTTG